MLSLEDTWIKAAVEHRTMLITYFSGRTKREETDREIEPDYVGESRDGRNRGLFATFCHLRLEGPRCFKPDSFIKFSLTDNKFTPLPPPKGRWKELTPLYEQRNLKDQE